MTSRVNKPLYCGGRRTRHLIFRALFWCVSFGFSTEHISTTKNDFDMRFFLLSRLSSQVSEIANPICVYNFPDARIAEMSKS
jgi:hypothetical protein